MSTWRYIKGSEKDFEGAPEWAVLCCAGGNCEVYYENSNYTGRWENVAGGGKGVNGLGGFPIIAQRERVTSVNDDRLARDMGVDVVNHPSHYTQGDVECIDAIKAATVGKNGIEAVCVANVIKYLWRYEEKNGAQDCHKARWYLYRLIKELEGK